jgi:hypothetical protein
MDRATTPPVGRRTLVEQAPTGEAHVQAKPDEDDGGARSGVSVVQAGFAGDVEASATGATAARASLQDLFGSPSGAQGSSLDALENELGEGAALGGREAALARSVGADPTALRVHSGPIAAQLAAEHDAVAFAAGPHVVMGSAAPGAGTPDGDALLLHEAAHVAQQQDAARDPTQRGRPIGEQQQAAEGDADRAAMLAAFGGTAGTAAPTAIQVQRADPAKVGHGMDRARYRVIELQLKNLVSQKKGVVDGPGKGDMAAIDAEIDKLIGELRVDFGVQLERGKILDDAIGGKDMLVVDGRIVLSPSGASHYMGERLGAKLEIDHIPPGETLQIGWRWRTPSSGQTYRFLINGPAFAEKTVSQEMALDTPFWGLVPDAVEKAQGLEIVAEIYIGKTDKPTKTFSTGFIAMPERPIGDVKIVGAADRVVKDSFVELGIGPWTPDFRRYSVDWFVDDAQVATDQLALRHQYSKLGKHATRAEVYRVRRNFGIRNKQLVRRAAIDFEVLSDEQYGNKFLNELESSPFRPKPVGVNELLTSGDRSVDEIQHRIDQGGSQQAFWKDRQKAQKERLGKVRALAPDHATARPLPSDATRLEPGGSYSGPITAALVMSSGGGAQPLTLHLTIRNDGGVWHARLIDSTSKKVLKADGSGATPLAAYAAVFETWRTDNDYPTGGHVVHRFTPPGWSMGSSFSTTTPWKRAKEWVDGIIQVGGFVVGMLLLADPDPTISKLLGGLIMAAVVARSSVAIYERIRNGGDVLSTENILDAVAIMTSFVGLGGGALRSLGVSARSPITYRVGNWMIMSAVAGDAGTFLYASAEALASLRTIQADPTMDDGQKSGELLRIMGSLFMTGALLITTNRELFRNGLKPHDFVKSDLHPDMKPELDVGARLDAEYELKKGGQWTKETSKLTDEAVLDKVFTQRTRQDLEAGLAKKVGAKPAAALADALGNDAFVELHHALGDDTMAALAKDIAAAKIGELHKELGTSGLGTFVREHGVPGTKKLLDRLTAAEIKKLVADLGATALKNLTSGASGLRGDEVAALVAKHGHDAVRWAGDTLDGATAKAILESVKPDTLKGLQDVSAADAHKIVEVFGTATVERAVPPVTGKQLNTERRQLGDKTAKAIADEKVKKHKVDDLATQADHLAAATTRPPTPLQHDSLIVDSNVLAGIKELMDGFAWKDLQEHKRNGINFLRSRAKPPLPPLSGDPAARDMEGVVGTGHDLRAANATLGESAPRPGLAREAFELTVSRDSQQYNNVLSELANAPAIGKNKGAADRAIVADTVFAKGAGKPTLMTGDTHMISRLFQRFGPGKARPIRQLPGEDVIDAITRTFPTGFDADIPNGTGGTRTVAVVPMT